LGAVKMTNIPVKFSKTPGRIRHTGRTQIGFDSIDILRSVGMSDPEIDQLIEQEIVIDPHRSNGKTN